MKRIIYLGTRLLFVAVAAAAIMAFGCHGSNVTDEAEIGTGGDDSGEEATDVITLASQSTDGGRGIFVTFPESIPVTPPETSVSKADAALVTQADYEAAVTVKDANGNLQVIARKKWLDSDQTLALYGAWKWCASYGIYLSNEKVGDATMPANDQNLDGDADCTSDVTFNDKYAAKIYVFGGEQVLDLSEKPFTLDPGKGIDDAWQYSVATGNRGPVNIGDLDGDGVLSLSATDNTTGSLLIWYDLADEEVDQEIPFKVGEYDPTKAALPVSVKDINGDGNDDIATVDYLVDANGDLIDANGDPVGDPKNGIFAYYYIFGGTDFSMASFYNGASYVYTFGSTNPSQCGAMVGNMDGDVSSEGHPIYDIAACLNWSSPITYQEVDIFYGDEGIVDLTGELYQSLVTSQPVIGNMDGGDLNGDGVMDILTAVYDRSVKGEEYAEARIYFMAKGQRASPWLSDPDVTIVDDLTQNFTSMEVGSPGDVNGDGISELMIFTSYYDENLLVSMPIIYVFFGREEWTSAGGDTTFYVSEADFTIDTSTDTKASFTKLPAIGDLDNDGYNEIPVMVSGGTVYYYAIFKGGKTLSGREFSLYSEYYNNSDNNAQILSSSK